MAAKLRSMSVIGSSSQFVILTTPGMSVGLAVHETSGLLAYCEMLHVEKVTGQWD
jgi:hypothetical protein